MRATKTRIERKKEEWQEAFNDDYVVGNKYYALHACAFHCKLVNVENITHNNGNSNNNNAQPQSFAYNNNLNEYRKKRHNNIWSTVLQCNYFVYILWECVCPICWWVCVPSPIFFLNSAFDIPLECNACACINFISILVFIVSSSVQKLKSMFLRMEKKKRGRFCANSVTVTTKSSVEINANKVCTISIWLHFLLPKHAIFVEWHRFDLSNCSIVLISSVCMVRFQK